MPSLPAVIVLALALTTGGAIAETAPDVATPYVAQLSDQGYGGITVGTTWLGRVVITANRDGIAREIVLNRRTGALLRDSAMLPPPAERMNMRPDDSDDNADQSFATTATTGTGATAGTALDVSGTETGSMLDAGDAKSISFGDGKGGAR